MCRAQLLDRPGTAPWRITIYGMNGYIQRIAVFDDWEVAVGPKDGPAYTSLNLTSAGTWKGTVASFVEGERCTQPR